MSQGFTKQITTVLESGRYTPTLTDVLNISALTARSSHYTRVGNQVIVNLELTTTPTAGSAADTKVGISLPFASSMSSSRDVVGLAIQLVNQTIGNITADTTNNRAELFFPSYGTGGRAWWGTFQYEIK
jgi:hypothetical protein